jgi:hypothetical protein
MIHSIFAMEVCLPFDTQLHTALRSLVVEHPVRAGYQEKWELYRRAASLTVGQLERVDRGCWDYFDDDARALRDYKMWVAGMTTEEGARTAPSGQSDPYRGEPRYMTLTMAFLIVQNSPTDLAMSTLCHIPEGDLWRRATFAHILNGMGALSFSSVESDVIYVIPGDAEWGLTAEDLSQSKFDYLRPVTA